MSFPGLDAVMSPFELLLVVGALLVVLCVILEIFKPKTKLPGPTPLPVLGNTLLFLNPKKILSRAQEIIDNYGGIFRFYLGTFLVVVVTEPKDIKKVLGSVTDRGEELTGFLRILFGDGLFSNSGEKWKRHHRLIVPTFHPHVLEQFQYSFNKQSQMLASKIERKCGQPVNLLPWLTTWAFTTVNETVMGADSDESMQTFKAMNHSILPRILKLFTRRVTRPWLLSDTLYSFTSDGKEMMELKKRYVQCVTDIIFRRLREAESDEPMQCEYTKRQAFIDLVLNSGDEMPLTPQEIQEEAFTLVAAGFETSSKAAGLTLVMLALHKEWQDAVQNELDEILGDSDCSRDISVQELGQLKVLESCIKETLRLYTVVPILPRKLPSAMKLGPDNATVPKGAIVLTVPFFTHRIPSLFPKPDEYNPGRFLADETVERLPYSFLPFGGGPRNCIGSRYAIMVVKTVIATLLRKFTLSPITTMDDILKCEVSISATPKQGLLVQLERRNIN